MRIGVYVCTLMYCTLCYTALYAWRGELGAVVDETLVMSLTFLKRTTIAYHRNPEALAGFWLCENSSPFLRISRYNITGMRT